MLNTVANVGLVLDLFSRERPEWGVTELAREVGLPKSNVHALVSSLVEIGLLTRTSGNRYRLGWHLLVLSKRLQLGSRLEEDARAEMQSLSRRVRETVLLSVLARDRVLYVERVAGTHPTVRLAGVGVGADLPLYCTAAGKVFLANMVREDALELVEAIAFVPRTARTLTSAEALMDAVDRARRVGFAYDDRECVPDACCVAAPIRDATGHVIACLTVSLPAYRFEESVDQVRAALLESAALVGQGLSEHEPRALEPAPA